MPESFEPSAAGWVEIAVLGGLSFKCAVLGGLSLKCAVPLSLKGLANELGSCDSRHEAFESV